MNDATNIKQVRTIETLFNKAKNGDKDAFTKLVSEYRPYLMKLARNRFSNKDDLDDIWQDTVYNAYNKFYEVEKASSFKSWITAILIHNCDALSNRYRHNKEKVERYIENVNNDEPSYDDDLEAKEILQMLNETDRKIFIMHHVEQYSIKEIAKELNMKPNTIKSILNRDKQKIREKFKTSTIVIFTICMIIVGGVIASSIISAIINYFDTKSAGNANDGTLEAIENDDWYQETNMDYIDLGNGYKIKVEYILMDEMNLSMVFDLKSEKENLSKYEDMQIVDLVITDESGNVIIDKTNPFAEQYNQAEASKSILREKNQMKELIFMYTDSFPKSKTLNINFSQIEISRDIDTQKIINASVQFSTNLDEKFINRTYTKYIANSDEIEKAIITETGFYAIVKVKKLNSISLTLLDENSIEYEISKTTLNNTNALKILIRSNFKDTKNNKLKLLLDNKEYELIKEN